MPDPTWPSLLIVCLVCLGIDQAHAAGNLIDSPTIGDLIYDSATGNVKLDASESAGGIITGFQLENFKNPNFPFVIGNYISPGGGFGGAFEDLKTFVIGDFDLTFTGFSGVVDIGNVFPIGLNQMELKCYLKNAVHVGPPGSGQQQFDLIVTNTPEQYDVKLVMSRNGGNYDFSWRTRAGKLYDLVSSTDIKGPPCSWEVYDPDGPEGPAPPYGDMSPSGTGTDILVAVPPKGPRRFFVVLEKY